MKAFKNVLTKFFRNWKQYSKAAVAVLGFVAAAGVAVLASPLAAAIPVGVIGWITAGTSFLTAVGVWWAKNEPMVEKVIGEVEDFAELVHLIPNAQPSSAAYLASIQRADPPTESFPVAGS